MSNLLWQYSLANYARDGVADACLALQDDFGLDVNLLLYGAWLASQGFCLTPAHLAELDSGIADWRDNVVRPLRALRRQMREYHPARDIREQVKVLELESERQQQDAMYHFYQQAPQLPEEEDSLPANLSLVASASVNSPDLCRPAIERLAALIAQ